jgi:hypothetical protein
VQEIGSRLVQGEVAMQTGQTVQTYALFVGVDIAAQTATVAIQRPGAKASRSLTIAQTPEGYTSPDPATTHCQPGAGREWPPQCADHEYGRWGCRSERG